MSTLYGFYSERAAAVRGTLVYSTPDGREVEVTGVVTSLDAYEWPDKVYVGQVVEFVRRGRAPMVPSFVERGLSSYGPYILERPDAEPEAGADGEPEDDDEMEGALSAETCRRILDLRDAMDDAPKHLRTLALERLSEMSGPVGPDEVARAGRALAGLLRAHAPALADEALTVAAMLTARRLDMTARCDAEVMDHTALNTALERLGLPGLEDWRCR